MQIYGELDPFFIGQFYNELGTRWNLYDQDGVAHQIDYNRSILNPLITFGWPRIRNYYGWTENKKLAFYYFGQDSFLMVSCENEGIISPPDFPPFHSFSTNVGNYRSFQMTMNSTHVNSSFLVS
jgi:hypothetical protein